MMNSRKRIDVAATLWTVVIALATCSVTSGNNETDRVALLEFKANTIDPFGVLSSWNSSSHFCQWFGVVCGTKHRRVIGLELDTQGLSGTISFHIGNLSFLRVISLPHNRFYSMIPIELGRLSRLRTIDLGNNSLTGPIPPSLSLCSNIANIAVDYNNLDGKLPDYLGSLSKLRNILLGNNDFNGGIPVSLGNLSHLEKLDLRENKLQGTIPETLGNLGRLRFLSLDDNMLTGHLPSPVTNISSLEYLVVTSNQLVGTLPSDIDTTLPNLVFLSVAYNRYTGLIPKSISNMSQLSVIQVSVNSFTGSVPSFRKLSNFLSLSAYDNDLGSGRVNDLDFVCSLTNATKLWNLEVDENNLGGEIPQCIGNLSLTLRSLWLENNALSGNIPSSIGNFINLELLALAGNNFSASIPPELGKLGNLGRLYMGHCAVAGEIPETMGNLSMLTHLYLQDNNLSGTIPSSLGNCQSLLLLDLSNNRLSGAIAREIMSLTSLSIYADFSRNSLSGNLPVEIGKLVHLGNLSLHNNNLSGAIPSSIGSCISLEYLYIQDNMFTGTIPSTLRDLKGIQELDFSNNRLSGQIPQFLKDLSLQKLDLSFNNFEGDMPTGGVFANTSATLIVGNEKLCGGLPEYRLPNCKSSARSTNHRTRNAIIYAVSGILVTVLLLISLLYFLRKRKQRRDVASGATDDGFMRVSYQDLLKATDGFSSANLIGNGSFGSVFRGVLALDLQVVAVKVLNLDRHGASKSFISECEALRNIRHRNLVKIITACSGYDNQGNEFKALVYEFMANGSLDEWLHPGEGTIGEQGHTLRRLSLLQRVNIASDVACALEYLHHQCETSIVHCDLKPSNILIDGKMTGHVGDFGLVRFAPDATRDLIAARTSSLGVKGSLGYIAPEYGAGAEVCTYGDVYSYGILVLEMFTGKRPTDDMFDDGKNLHAFAKTASREQLLQIIDPVLHEEIQRSYVRFPKIQECLVSIIEIGVACSSEVPSGRMSMRDVAAALLVIREDIREVWVN